MVRPIDQGLRFATNRGIYTHTVTVRMPIIVRHSLLTSLFRIRSKPGILTHHSDHLHGVAPFPTLLVSAIPGNYQRLIEEFIFVVSNDNLWELHLNGRDILLGVSEATSTSRRGYYQRKIGSLENVRSMNLITPYTMTYVC